MSKFTIANGTESVWNCEDYKSLEKALEAAGSEYDISSLKNSQFQMRWWWVVAVETPCLTGDDVVIGFSKDDDSVIVIFDNVATNFRVPRQYSRDEILRTILLEGVDRMVEKFGRH